MIIEFVQLNLLLNDYVPGTSSYHTVIFCIYNLGLHVVIHLEIQCHEGVVFFWVFKVRSGFR
jgi:hypothetical protein